MQELCVTSCRLLVAMTNNQLPITNAFYLFLFVPIRVYLQSLYLISCIMLIASSFLCALHAFARNRFFLPVSAFSLCLLLALGAFCPGVSLWLKSFYFFVSKTAHYMIINHSCCLHMCITDSRAHKREPSFFQILAHSVRLFCCRRDFLIDLNLLVIGFPLTNCQI